MNSLAVFLGRSLAYFFRIFPQSLRWRMGKALGYFWFDVLKLRRWTVLKNLTIAFPDMSHEEKYRVARESMAHLCYGFFEFTQMPFMDKAWLQENAVFEGEEHLQKALSFGKGVLILSLHVGNGDMGIASLSLRGYPIHVISKKFKNKFANDFWFGMRSGHGTGFLEPHGSQLPFEILKLTKKNCGVIFVIDQFMGKPFGVATQFFGRKTGTQKGLALFAMKTGCPVIPIYTYRGPDLKTHVRVEEPILSRSNLESLSSATQETTMSKDDQIIWMTDQYNRRLEQIITRHKEQWMWVHRRWKRFE